MLEKERSIETDVLVVGTGLAGLRAAIEAKRYNLDVLLVEKMEPGRVSNSAFAGGGFRYAGMSRPSYESAQICDLSFNDHFEHMVECGEFLSNQKLAETLAIEACPRVMELKEFGVDPIWSAPIPGPLRGGQRETLPMTKYAKELGVHVLGNTFLTELIQDEGAVTGAVGLDVFSGDFIVLRAKSTVLATGGAAEIYNRNDTTVNVVGDGYAMAYHAGASLVDMEMVMPDPILLAEPGLPWSAYIPVTPARWLGVLRNALGEPFEIEFMKEHNLIGPKATLSVDDPFPTRYDVHPSDVREQICRAMVLEVREGRGDNGAVLMDFTKVPIEEWMKYPSGRASLSLLRGFPIDKKPVHVLPGMICTLGGIRIGENGETDVLGLYAAGEAAGGVHGAGRLGGNSFSDCVVFGARAGRSAALHARGVRIPDADLAQIKEKKEKILLTAKGETNRGGDVKETTAKLKSLMWERVGLLRSARDLEAALTEIDRFRKENISRLHGRNPRQLMRTLELMNMIDVGEMIARAALMRTESRGCHYRLDYSKRDNRNWLKNIFLRRKNQRMELWTEPVVVTRLKPPED